MTYAHFLRETLEACLLCWRSFFMWLSLSWGVSSWILWMKIKLLVNIFEGRMLDFVQGFGMALNELSLILLNQSQQSEKGQVICVDVQSSNLALVDWSCFEFLMLFEFSLELFLHIDPHTFSFNFKLGGRLAFLTLSEPLNIELILEYVSGLEVVDDHSLNYFDVFSQKLDENDQDIDLFGLGWLQRMGEVLCH